jgi:hypothetical protein
MMVSSKSSTFFILCPPWITKYRQTKLLCVTYEKLTISHFQIASVLLHQYTVACFLQYSETNVMLFLFSLLRINGLYMFRASIAHS